MKAFNVPLVVVGGGGYTIRNVAKTWTYETGALVGKELDENLPFNDYIQYFGPEYKLEVPPTSMDNRNSPEYLANITGQIADHLRSLPFAPSVQQQETPRQSLNVASLELSDDEDSDLDERITQRMRDAHIERLGDELSDDENEGPWEGMEIDGRAAAAAAIRGASSKARRRKAGDIGIAGGPRGSAPWKHGQATADLNDSPRGPGSIAGTNGENGAAVTMTTAGRPKRSFFKSRAADVDWSSSVPRTHPDAVLAWRDDIDGGSGHPAGAAASAAAAGGSALGGPGDATASAERKRMPNGDAYLSALNGGSRPGSERPDSPVMSSIRDSPHPGAS